MIRLILKGSCQITEDIWEVYYETMDIDCPKLEERLKRKGCTPFVVSAEIVEEQERGA